MGSITRQEEIFIDVDNELHQTVKGMISDNYIERFKAEYNQLAIRTNKLKVIIDKARDNSIEFELKSKLRQLEWQVVIMVEYMKILKERAKTEGINLD